MDSIRTQSIAAILAALDQRETFLVTSHARPDGDAIGSSLALMHLLDSMGKTVYACFSDPIPHAYERVPGVKRIQRELPSEPVDCAILLECDAVPRTGYKALPARFVINVDHHLSGRAFADLNWIDPEAPAVGAMVYEIAVASGKPITAAMATCLYTAVLTDTGGFLYSSTTASTFALAEHLLLAGADAHGVTQSIYFSTPQSKMRLLGKVLERMKIQNTVAWSWVTQQDMNDAGASLEDCEGIVNYLIGMADVCAAVFLREQPEGGDFRLSLRSKSNVDVAEVASRFSGGGHRNASGGTVQGPLDLAVSRVVGALEQACVATVG